VGPLATRLYAQSGQIEAGLTLAQSLYENAEDPETQKTFEHRIKELELERTLRELDDAIDAYTRRKGRAPSSMQELIANGDLNALPADPLGGELVIGTDGRIQSTARTRRLTVYEPRKD
jgi:hypothetical protein